MPVLLASGSVRADAAEPLYPTCSTLPSDGASIPLRHLKDDHKEEGKNRV